MTGVESHLLEAETLFQVVCLHRNSPNLYRLNSNQALKWQHQAWT